MLGASPGQDIQLRIAWLQAKKRANASGLQHGAIQRTNYGGRSCANFLMGCRCWFTLALRCTARLCGRQLRGAVT